MVDSISVIGPGWRATDSSGVLITDGVLEFFDAGTSNARTVYSDSTLSTSLGTTVDCNSGGYPVTSGNARTLIYTGNTAYKVRLTSVTVGGTVWEHDNVLGALDTSDFLTEAAVADQSVVAVSTNRSVTIDDKGKLLNVNCTGGDVTITLDDAANLGDGFFVGIRHDGTANQVLITGDGTDTFGISGVNTTGFSLVGRGQAIWITCDATQFKTHSESPPFIGGAIGVITIADRLSTPPGSTEAGERYIVGSGPSGDWSGFSEHDIAEADGFGGWFNYTPVTDCGWVAYVQDENAYYSFIDSAWVQGEGSSTVAGRLRLATQAEQETGTDTTVAVPTGRQQNHPSAAKCWGYVTVSTGTPTLQTSYNITSITDAGVGLLTVTIATDFSSANYCVGVSIGWAAGDDGIPQFRSGSLAVGSFQIQTSDGGNEALEDPVAWGFWAFGDQ